MGFLAITTIAWREILLYLRNKGRILATLGAPFFYLVILGFGLDAILPIQGTNYFSFLVAGIMSMVILFHSMFSSLSVVTERQFGFLKEMLVAPIRRTDIVLGKAIGNSLTATAQAVLVLGIAFLVGFQMTQSFLNLLWMLPLLFLAAIGFSGMGLAFASRIKDPQTFQFLFNFLVLPLFLLSGAVFPLESAPSWLQGIVFLDPLTYLVEGLRALLLGLSQIPFWISILGIIVFDAIMILIAALLFRKIE
ncbi:ABC transporter permease [Candidatus Micrarchaeota archaeon]|nr:ABC transporter permease [Candidatus Micrarchaeota archaeon]MBU1929984.1 ABC transporter permease [Candidatus Micrarchaeota archaeon]